MIPHACGEDYSIEIIFLDFAKASDSVSDNKLLKKKLFEIGFGPLLLNWCKAFISNRTQRVVIVDNISRWKNVTSGVKLNTIIEYIQ